MLKYFLGFLKNFFNQRISVLSLTDNLSVIDNKACINRFAKIYNSKIDAYSYVGENTEIINASVGKFCSIADSCSIGLAAHTIENMSTSPIFTEKINGTKSSWISHDIGINLTKNVIVGNDVWVGKRVIVLSGVKIGNGCIIGAGSIVTKDVKDYSIIAGVPAKVIRYRFEEDIIVKLQKLEWWNLPIDTLKKHINVFQKNKFDLDDLNQLKYNV